MRRGADSKEVGRGQRSTTDQSSVHIRLREQFRGIGRLDAATVKQTGQTGNHNIFFLQLATNEGMYLLGLFRAGSATRADRPDGLVGNDRRLETGNTIERYHRLQLASDDG